MTGIKSLMCRQGQLADVKTWLAGHIQLMFSTCRLCRNDPVRLGAGALGVSPKKARGVSRHPDGR